MAIINNGNNSEITTVAQLENNTYLIMAELEKKISKLRAG